MQTTINETKSNLLREINLNEANQSHGLDYIADQDHKYLKDLKINVSNALNSENLNRKEAVLIALSVAVNQNNQKLKMSLFELAEKEGVSQAEVAEVLACVSLLNVNNVYYRFKHYVKKDFYQTASAGIKMSIMVNPVLGKEFFELLSLVVSSLNGCELCVNSHEESLMRHGSSETRVLEAIRLGAVIKGLSVLID